MMSLRNKLRLVVLAAIPVLALPGCRSHHADASKIARVRFVDAVPGPIRMDLSVKGKGTKRGVAYQEDTGFVDLDPGRYALRATEEIQPSSAAEVDGVLHAGRAYTVMALPTTAAGKDVGLRVIRETTGEMSKDRATVRFIDAAPEYRNLSLALDNVVAVDGLPYAEESTPLSLAPGNYALKLWTGDDSLALLGPSPAHFDGGRSYTVIAMGRRSDNSLTLQVYEDK